MTFVQAWDNRWKVLHTQPRQCQTSIWAIALPSQRLALAGAAGCSGKLQAALHRAQVWGPSTWCSKAPLALARRRVWPVRMLADVLVVSGSASTSTTHRVSLSRPGPLQSKGLVRLEACSKPLPLL